MTAERWKRIEEVYHGALECPPQQRASFLAEACHGDEDLRKEVEDLVRREDSPAANLLDRSPVTSPEEAVVPWASGTRLGPYEIVEPIAAGGMGLVFRAVDTRLGRSVAIKTSQTPLSPRFAREARAIASLNHPNICTLHDVGPDYLVMELLEGPTLADRIKKGPIPLEEALGIARQIAAALEAAHENGIVHRDLKPANVKLRPDGSVKVLDFGLAKSRVESEPTPESVEIKLSGLILGTVTYMSPEQALGQDVDKRGDIWAFGVVLYEMLTGARPFDGATVSDCLAGIVQKEPDLTKAPQSVRRLLGRCLEKDPKERLRDLGDWDDLLDPEDSQRRTAAAPASRQTFRGTLILLALAIAGTGAIWLARNRPLPLTHRTLIVTSEEGLSSPSISPDGRKVAYVAKGKLNLRDLSQSVPVEVSDSQNAAGPFWSPDSKWVGYSTRTEIRKTSADGGSSRTVCRIPTAVQGAAWTDVWDPNGLIVYALNATGIFRVPAEGGEPMRILDGTATQTYDFHQIVFLGRSDDFLTWTHKSGNLPGTWIRVSRRGETRLAAPDEMNRTTGAAWSPAGFLLTSDNGVGLSAIPMGVAGVNRSSQTILIDPEGQSPSVDAAGTLVYLRRNTGTDQLLTVDRAGHVIEEFGKPVPAVSGMVVSPDGRRVAIQTRTGLWIYEVSGGALARLVNSLDGVTSPRWSADGGTLGFVAGVGGTSGGQLYVQPADSSAGPQVLWSDAVFFWDWSRARDHIVFSTQKQANQQDIFVADLNSGSLVGLANTKASETRPEIDPTGRYLAYHSDETGSSEVYVRTFPGGSGKWAVSAGGGTMPHWSARGDELFYLKGETLMSAKVTSKNTFHVEGQPRELFANDAGRHFKMMYFAPMPDGRQFVIPRPTGDQSLSIMLMENWQKK